MKARSMGTSPFAARNGRHVELPSHEAAETWQNWMTSTGFETQHED